MTILRNPFRIRASEQATDDEFLDLFGAELLDVLPGEQLWNRLLILSYPPGSGKTTLLRLFTPDVLNRVWDSPDENPDLISRLQSVGAITADGPRVLGVTVDCREQYAAIADLRLGARASERLFFGLLDARLRLLVLRAALVSVGLRFPADVAMVELRPNHEDRSSEVSLQAISGSQIYEEARATEEAISGAIDSLTGVEIPTTLGRSRLAFLRELSAANIFVGGDLLQRVPLMMFDDVQSLEPEQRVSLRKDLEFRGLRVARWIAQRSEVVDPGELIGSARTEGRDFSYAKDLVELDKRGVVAQLMTDVADRRVHRSSIDVRRFSGCLRTSLTNPPVRAAVTKALKESEEQVRERVRDRPQFSEWVEYGSRFDGTEFERAIVWRGILIVVERRRRRQLDLHAPHSSAELEKELDSDLREAARLFLSREHRLPYYYGSDQVTDLAASNVEQFLAVAGELFERVVVSATATKSKRKSLSASEQDGIIRRLSEKKVQSLSREVPQGSDVAQLVSSIGSFSRDQTYRPSAPYKPGVTGIAISMNDVAFLRDPINRKDPLLARLYETLASAIAHNVLQARPDRRVKGGTWLVLYLNRLLCPAYDLPTKYGGFREQTIETLKEWMTVGYSPSQQSPQPLDGQIELEI